MSESITASVTKGLVGVSAVGHAASGTTRALSVAIYLHDLSGGGVERQSLIIAEELRRHGVDVTLVVSSLQGQLLTQVPQGLRVIDLGSSRTLWDIPRLAGFMRREQPDILLANVDFNNVAALMAKAAGLCRTKVVICQHNSLSPGYLRSQTEHYLYLGLYYRLLGSLVDRAVAVSSGVADELVKLAKLPRDKVLTIHNPVVGPDFVDRCNEVVAHPWLHQPGRPVFVTAGRLVPQKDHACMLRALAMHRQKSDSRLILLGTGPLETELKALAHDLGLTEAVDFRGFEPNPLPFFRQSDAFLMSSLSEGFGNVLVEALACGTPVISSRCDHGPAEILDHGRFGVLVESRDPHALAAAMNEVGLLAARFPADVLRRRAGEFSYAACASQYMSLLRALAPNRARVA
jgi:glycosyltransferase involved in cell wall biosynthesis